MSEAKRMSVAFGGIEAVAPGTVFDLLWRSYAGWPGREAHRDRWQGADREFFAHPRTVGACGVFGFMGREPVGFARRDPRGFPVAAIGHNCVVPEWRGRGIGGRQVRWVLERLASEDFERVEVTTGTGELFAPARRMYRVCGFVEAPADVGLGGEGIETVGFVVDLSARAG